MIERYDGDPDRFVKENQELLVRILKHSDDAFVRALALNALVLYGNEPTLEDIEREFRRAKRGTTD